METPHAGETIIRLQLLVSHSGKVLNQQLLTAQVEPCLKVYMVGSVDDLMNLKMMT